MKEINVTELKDLLDSKADFQLIDVREPHEIKIADIGGHKIPMGQITASEDKIARDKRVVVYCRSGGRSGQVVQYLEQKLGHNEIYNLTGGILAWADQIDQSVQKY